MPKVTDKPFAPACERNQQVILDVLEQVVTSSDHSLLEIGSGTGQHAVFMAPHFPHLRWQTSDLTENHAGIQMWLEAVPSPNLLPPIHYQAGVTEFPRQAYDVVFTANTLHIMSWSDVQAMIADWGSLTQGARVVIYGPFNYQGQFTSDSNAQFEQWLKERNPESGIRDFEAVCDLMEQQALGLQNDVAMPANNRCLVFVKK